ncbi:MAG: Holliday junction resolvase Hjc [Candidatus Micrarchaeota archaeon]|nr:Holliday junction resolvase Hjc [Candidatus Micrarchaeota archaeon]
MYRYKKGARNERELIKIFEENGYSVVRSAGSGINSISPDILMFKRGKQYAMECKAWNSDRIAIDHEKFDALMRWEENTGITTLIAWKMPYDGWYFAYLPELERNEKSYSITKKKMMEINRKIEDII